MNSDYDPIVPPTATRSRPWLGWAIVLLFAFAAGLGAMYWAQTRWSGIAGWRAQPLTKTPAATTATAATAAPQAIVPAAPREPIADAAAIDRRLEELDMRVASMDAAMQGAIGNADRAEALLVAFAARRALDQGTALGYIESLLRERFGGTQPQAVATILSAARQPVTLDALATGLESVAPALATDGPDEGWWHGFRRELAGLVVIRRASTPSPAPADRLARAGRLIEAGNVEAALAEVARMPGRDAAAAWIAQARRYVAARGALDRIETAALLAPRAPTIARGTVYE